MVFSDGIVLALPFLRKSFVMEEGSRALAGRFCLFEAGVVTYSRWSDRHLSLDESLSGHPSENPCPIRGG